MKNGLNFEIHWKYFPNLQCKTTIQNKSNHTIKVIECVFYFLNQKFSVY